MVGGGIATAQAMVEVAEDEVAESVVEELVGERHGIGSSRNAYQVFGLRALERKHAGNIITWSAGFKGRTRGPQGGR